MVVSAINVMKAMRSKCGVDVVQGKEGLVMAVANRPSWVAFWPAT